MMSTITCRSALKNCKNPHESMGEICVLCNKCGRFNKEDNKEKQIEEMARDIPQRIVAYDRDPDGQYLYTEQRLEIARTFYNAGYRKQSEGEWILCERLYDYEVDTWKCSQCQTFIRDDEKRKMKFCPNCGAKMKGGGE